MSYLVINDFRYGLDKRRIDLALRPGALNDAVNCHITQGGEIEKRKAFVRTALALTAGGGPVSTFGLTALETTMEIYGNVPVANIDGGTIPTDFTYKDLRMIVPVTSTTNIIYTLIDVVYSTVFGGKAFVIGRMSGGFNALFYDGTLIFDSIAGIVRALETNNAGILRRLGDAITNTGLYTVSYSVPTGILSVFGPAGATYALIIRKVSAAGTLTEQKIAVATAPIPGATASGSFQIVAGSTSAGTNKISQVKVGATNLLGAAVDFDTDTTRTAIALTVAIVAFSGTSGYTATSEGSRVIITSMTEGTTPNDKEIEVTAAGDVCTGICVTTFSGTGFNLNSISANGTNLLTGTPLAYPGFPGQALSAYVETIAANVRAGTGTHGYVAKALATSLYLSKAVTKSGDSPIDVVIDIVPTTGSGEVGAGTGMVVVMTPSKVFFRTTGPGGHGWLSDPMTVKVTGGAPPYAYYWDLNPGSDIDMVNSTVPAKLKLVPMQPNSATTQYVADSNPPFPIGDGTYPSRSVPVGCLVVDILGTEVRSPSCAVVLPGSVEV